MRVLFRIGAALLIICMMISVFSMAEPPEDETLPEEPPMEEIIPPDPTEETQPEVSEEEIEPEEEYIYPNDWSRNALIFAVENGIFKGDKDRNLNPDQNITRAEMAAVLVRLLGATETTSLSAFADVSSTAWYYGELSAAVACGIFGGTSANAMQPNQPITREQAVVVLCRAFGIVSNNFEAYKEFSDKGSVSAFARDSVSAMRVRGFVNGYSDGSFQPKKSITRAEVAQLLYNIFDVVADTPEEITTEGTIIYRGAEELPQQLDISGTLIIGQAAQQVIAPQSWNISYSLVLRTGKDTQADLSCVQTEKLVCAMISGMVTAPPRNELYLGGTSCDYFGDASTITVVGGDHSFTGNSSLIYLRGGSLIHNGNTGDIYMQGSTALELNGLADYISVDGDRVKISGNGKAAYIVISYEHRDITLAYDEMKDIWYETYGAEHDNALNVVQTQKIPCKVLYDTVLYTNFNMNTVLCNVKAGTIVYNEYHPKDEKMYVSLPDGTKGYINRWLCDLPLNMVTTNGNLDYSKATKEGFVDLMGCRSATQYLIWVSKYTQKVMVFTGTKGDWNLIKTFPCATGTNNTPTPAGSSQTFGHEARWYYSDHCIDNVTYFNGWHAFHTVLMNYDGTFYNATVGVPMSHGCVRLLPEAALYIYNLPLCTGVIVY